jgi:hypothetical protein
MKRQSLIVTFVLGALLLSAWGNVIAAGFCPRFALHRDCCPHLLPQPAKQTKQEPSCHHEMAGMKMDGMQMDEADAESSTNSEDSQPEVASASLTENLVLDLPAQPCTHCVIHSQPTSATVSVLTVDPAKRMVETDALPAIFASNLPGGFVDMILPTEHGPPAPSAPRHVLINIFRI